MPEYVGRRIIEGAVSFWVILTLIFVLIQIVPGDPAEAALAQSAAPRQVLERRRESLGLDQPIFQQYIHYLRGLSGDESVISWATGESVRTAVAGHFMPTMQVAVFGTAIAAIAGIGLGMLGALGGAYLSGIGRSLSGVLVAVPVMFSGTLFVWIFAVVLGLLPATGETGMKSLILPSFAVGLSTAGAIARAVDTTLVEVLEEPFILAARARGLQRSRIALRHALPVALVPVLDVFSVQFGYLLAGTVVVETVFARQGLGRLLLVAVLNKDLPVVQAVVAVSALFYIAFSIIADILRTVIDPRIRIE